MNFHLRAPAFARQSSGARAERCEHRLDRRPEHVLQRAGEQDDQPLDDDDHVARDVRHLEGELGAALVEHAEQDRRGHDAGRMRAAHQRHGDADEAGAGDEIERHVVLVAHDRVERHHAGQRAGDHHGDDDDAASRRCRHSAPPSG